LRPIRGRILLFRDDLQLGNGPSGPGSPTRSRGCAAGVTELTARIAFHRPLSGRLSASLTN